MESKTDIKVKRTITTIFMVPTLKIPRVELEDNRFINGFVKDGMNDLEYNNCIFLLFKPRQLDRFREFLDKEYERTAQIIDDYDYPNGFVVVVYKLDDDYMEDFKLIRQGKYSKTSPNFQEMFPKVVKIVNSRGLHRDEISLQYRVFNRTDDLIRFWEDKFNLVFESSQELWHGFEEDRETLTEDKLIDNELYK